MKHIDSPDAQLEGFLRRYTPEIAGLAKAVLVKLRKRLPGAVEMVYDNYNALVIGFGPSERASEAILSIALYPRWINLFFLWGKKLRDPEKLLKGSGNQVRSLVIENAGTLDDPAVEDLIAEALERAAVPIDPAGARRILIRAIAAKQRPRRLAK
ncbi:MAG: hypothetical protein ABSF12_00755 [Bryobacteraceae bacterium]